MARVNAHLTFNGNCEEAFGFYKSVFSGEFRYVGRMTEIPPMPGYELPESAKEKIMHISLPISSETILTGSDANPLMGNVAIGQNISLLMAAASKEEADSIFTKLSEGGKTTMPLTDTFWGSYFGMLVDKFGIIWMVSYDYPSS